MNQGGPAPDALLLLLVGIRQHREGATWRVLKMLAASREGFTEEPALSLGLRAELKLTSNKGPSALGRGSGEASRLGLGS